VVQPHQIQYRGVNVVDGHRMIDASMPSSSVAPKTIPPRSPPPLSHTEYPATWWSRPGATSQTIPTS
jgi:hypothetical protein